MPIPTYVLWMNFERYNGPHSILIIPALFATAAGYLDKDRGPLRAALWLAAATYCVIFLDAVLEFKAEDWLLLPAVLAGAAVWSAIVIGVPTLLCTLLGAWIRIRFVHLT